MCDPTKDYLQTKISKFLEPHFNKSGLSLKKVKIKDSWVKSPRELLSSQFSNHTVKLWQLVLNSVQRYDQFFKFTYLKSGWHWAQEEILQLSLWFLVYINFTMHQWPLIVLCINRRCSTDFLYSIQILLLYDIQGCWCYLSLILIKKKIPIL